MIFESFKHIQTIRFRHVDIQQNNIRRRESGFILVRGSVLKKSNSFLSVMDDEKIRFARIFLKSPLGDFDISLGIFDKENVQRPTKFLSCITHSFLLLPMTLTYYTLSTLIFLGIVKRKLAPCPACDSIQIQPP